MEQGYENRYKLNTKHSFAEGMNYACMIIQNEDHTIEDKILLLDYLSNTIRTDMQTDILSNIIYNPVKNEPIELPQLYIPSFYIDENGESKEVYISRTADKEIELGEETVLSYPWSQSKLTDKIKLINKVEFKYYNDNHDAYYYPEIGICQVLNGQHSIACGIYHKKGKIWAKIINMQPLFDNIYTNDGTNWYSKYDNRTISKIKDFRIGLLFELVKIKLKLMESIKENDNCKEQYT